MMFRDTWWALLSIFRNQSGSTTAVLSEKMESCAQVQSILSPSILAVLQALHVPVSFGPKYQIKMTTPDKSWSLCVLSGSLAWHAIPRYRKAWVEFRGLHTQTHTRGWSSWEAIYGCWLFSTPCPEGSHPESTMDKKCSKVPQFQVSLPEYLHFIHLTTHYIIWVLSV